VVMNPTIATPKSAVLATVLTPPHRPEFLKLMVGLLP
jgi:hypothetical protein